MQNPKLKFRQNFIVFEKSFYLEKLKMLTSSSYNKISSNFALISYLPISTKPCLQNRKPSFCNRNQVSFYFSK